MDLANNWRKLSEELPEGVRLLAVSKGHPSSSIRQLAQLGQIDFGESRLQEALSKLDELSDLKALRWHFIGHLQSNKVRAVVQNFEYIHSVDSENLAERISRIAGEENRSIKVMLQVKFAEDKTKGGFSPEELLKIIDKLCNLPHLQVIGLMTMAPLEFPLNARRQLFEECRLFATRLSLQECSMGMSSDWKEAINAQATWLRLGSCLFGRREV